MADLKISQLTDGGASQAADEYVIARSGANYRIDGASVAAAATSVGTLTSLTVSGDLTVDTNTLSVNATSNRVGIGTTSAVWNSAEKLVVSQSVDAPVITGYSTFGAGTPVLVSWNSATSGTREHIWFADSASGGVRGKIATNGANGLQFLYGSTVGMSLDSSGNFIVDTNTLYVDAANNRVGVGTASPTAPFHVRVATNANLRFANDSGVTRLQAINDAETATVDFKLQSDQLILLRAGGSETARFDASGNLGLGVTPQSFSANRTSLQIHGTVQPNIVFSGNPANGGAMWSNAYYDGAADRYLATGVAARFGFSGNGFGWDLAPSGSAGAAATFTNRMTLDASGNLGVGATSPDIYSFGSGGKYLTLQNTASGGFSLVQVVSEGTTGGGVAFGNATIRRASIEGINGSHLAFYTNGTNSGTSVTERARITSAGFSKASNNGAYGNGNPNSTFHEFHRNDNGAGLIVYCESTAQTNTGFAVNVNRTTTNNTYRFLECAHQNVAVRFEIRDSGDAYNTNGTYGTLSDERLKQDIVDASSQWNDIKALRFRKFRMKSDVEAEGENAPFMLGVIAQEVEQVSPGLVTDSNRYEDREVTDKDGNVTTEQVLVSSSKTVKSSILLMKAAVALQEAMARIEALEARLEALEA